MVKLWLVFGVASAFLLFFGTEAFWWDGVKVSVGGKDWKDNGGGGKEWKDNENNCKPEGEYCEGAANNNCCRGLYCGTSNKCVKCKEQQTTCTASWECCGYRNQNAHCDANEKKCKAGKEPGWWGTK